MRYPEPDPPVAPPVNWAWEWLAELLYKQRLAGNAKDYARQVWTRLVTLVNRVN